LAEERRSPDPMLIDMHGKMNTLLERSDNTNDFLDSVSRKTEDNQRCISKLKGEITGIKAIGAFVSVIFASVFGLFWKR